MTRIHLVLAFSALLFSACGGAAAASGGTAANGGGGPGCSCEHDEAAEAAGGCGGACEHHEGAEHAEGGPTVAPGEAHVGDATTCPVSGERFVVNEQSPHAEYEGRTYYFCCPHCIERFQANPGQYAHPPAAAAPHT